MGTHCQACSNCFKNTNQCLQLGIYSKQDNFFLEQIITLPGRSEESLAAVTPYRLHLCPILHSQATKLSGHYYVCSMHNPYGPRDPGSLSEEYPFETFAVVNDEAMNNKYIL